VVTLDILPREGEMREENEIEEGDCKKPLTFVLGMRVEFIDIDGLSSD
jgi:hypothetical protein